MGALADRLHCLVTATGCVTVRLTWPVARTKQPHGTQFGAHACTYAQFKAWADGFQIPCPRSDETNNSGTNDQVMNYMIGIETCELKMHQTTDADGKGESRSNTQLDC